MNHLEPEKSAQIKELAPCGVYCGACPSFPTLCTGCSSADQVQRRTSWIGCQIRECCYEKKRILFCAECTEFPCEMILENLISSYPDNPKYDYRHEIPENVEKFRILGLEGYLNFQEQKWTCPLCGGRVTFYDYRCQKCGKKVRE